MEKRLATLDGRGFLVSGRFPGFVVSCPRLDELAASMKVRSWKKGFVVNQDKDELYILKKGTVSEKTDRDDQVLEEGSWLNLQSVLPFAGIEGHSEWTALTAVRAAAIPGRLIREIPVLGWSLAE
jgi:hypothetical protein